ncbi:cytosine permease [Rhodococcus hoagii]|nr:cytosine permease [Prescottella equi]
MTHDDGSTSEVLLTPERRTIDVVPDDERHGTPRSQFTLWFGANMQITAIVDARPRGRLRRRRPVAIIGLLIGNVFGGAVMALHSAQGPRMGLPQMISSRAQFGVKGAVIPLVLVILMYLGFAATGTVLAGQAVNKVLGLDSAWIGIVIFGLLTAFVAVTGYKLIHIVGKIATVVGIVGFTYLAIRLFLEYDVLDYVGIVDFDFVTFLLAISLGAGWQLTFGPYVARLLPLPAPRDQRAHHVLVDLPRQRHRIAVVDDLRRPRRGRRRRRLPRQPGRLHGRPRRARDHRVPDLPVIVTGKLTVNVLTRTAASCRSSPPSPRSTAVRRFDQGPLFYILGFTVISMFIAIAASADFLDNFKNFVLVLLMVFTPWSAIT